MKQILKLGLTLAAFAVVSCLALAVVNNFTAPVIEKNNAAKTSAGLTVVFPEADSFESVNAEKSINKTTIEGVWLAKKGDTVLGGVAKVTGPTYDKSTILTGFDKNMKISGVVILETSDSPGFGQNAKDPSYKTSTGKTFYGQFEGVDAKNGVEAGKNFEALSGATITSNGIAALINDAAAAVKGAF
ncbi:MAG: FMN-binding protein [Treponema sp.]|nr:FMN-binding protein [Treponema sp.]